MIRSEIEISAPYWKKEKLLQHQEIKYLKQRDLHFLWAEVLPLEGSSFD